MAAYVRTRTTHIGISDKNHLGFDTQKVYLRELESLIGLTSTIAIGSVYWREFSSLIGASLTSDLREEIALEFSALIGLVGAKGVGHDEELSSSVGLVSVQEELPNLVSSPPIGLSCTVKTVRTFARELSSPISVSPLLYSPRDYSSELTTALGLVGVCVPGTKSASLLYYYESSAWARESLLAEIELIKTIDSPAYLEAIIANPANDRDAHYPSYRQIRIIEKHTLFPVYLGYVEYTEPFWHQAFGPCLKIRCKDNLQELGDRPLNTDYSGTPRKRSALIAQVVSDYASAGNVSTAGVETSNSAETITPDYTKYDKDCLSTIRDLGQEDPWTDETWGATWRWNGASYDNNTTEANSSGGTPFAFLADTDDYYYLGNSEPFLGAEFDLDTLGSYGALTWEYWNGSSWTALTVTSSYDFTADGSVIWEIETDWVTRSFSGADPHANSPPDATTRYWVRVSAASVAITATILQITVMRANAYDFYLDEGKVLQYFRRGSRPSGGAASNGLTIALQEDPTSQKVRMLGNYSFNESPKEIITRVTVRGTDSNGDQISHTEINSDLESSIGYRKEKIDIVYGTSSASELENRAKALLHQPMGGTIIRGKVSVVGYPRYALANPGSIEVLKPGELVHIHNSNKNINEDYLVLKITYREPANIATLDLIKGILGWGFPPHELEAFIETLKSGFSISSAKIGDLVVGNAQIMNLEASKVIVSGSITLADWRHATDPEKFDGGDVYTGSIDKTGLNFSAFDKGVDDLDDVDEGSTYGKVNLTQISAGNIKLTSATVKDSEWYNESGVEIDATHGINIYGTANALTTRATKTGTIQCYVGADGKIYAGAGAVGLSEDGIKIKGENLKMYDVDDNYIGLLAGHSTGFSLYAINQPLKCYSNAGRGILIWAGTVPGVAPAVDTLDLRAQRDVEITPGASYRAKIDRMSTTPTTPIGGTIDTNYQNTTGCPLLVTVVVRLDPVESAEFQCDSTSSPTTIRSEATNASNADHIRVPLSYIVPVGWYWRIYTAAGTPSIATWDEIRIGQ